MKVVVKTKAGTILEVEFPKPKNLRDQSEDCLNDAVSDILDEKNIDYKWFRITQKSDTVREIFRREECVFQYCPNPESCKDKCVNN